MFGVYGAILQVIVYGSFDGLKHNETSQKQNIFRKWESTWTKTRMKQFKTTHVSEFRWVTLAIRFKSRFKIERQRSKKRRKNKGEKRWPKS